MKNENYRQQIEDLKALVYKLSDKTTTSITTNNTINNTVTIKIENYILASPEVMSIENLQKYIPNLKNFHLLNNGNGIGRFVLDYIVKDIRMITSDLSRGIVFYKGENGQVIRDTGLNQFFIMLCKAYSCRVEDLMKKLIDDMKLDLSDPEDIAKQLMYTKIITQIKQCANGDKSEFIPSALKIISSGTDHKNLI